MSTLRITEGAAATYQALAGLRSASARLAAVGSKLSSGRQITRPSDDPAGTADALRTRAELARGDQYRSNSADAIGWLSSLNSTFSSLVAQTQKVRDLVLRGLNPADTDSRSAATLAGQVDALRQGLLATANTSHLGRPLLGGTTAGSATYDAGGAYQGDSGTVSRQIGTAETVTVNALGPQVFGADGSNLFDVLTGISTALRTDPSTLSGSLTALDAALSRISTAQASAGSVYARVRAAQTAGTAMTTALTSHLSDLEDIDIANMAIDVTTADMAYQAARQTTARVRQVSLLDFLR